MASGRLVNTGRSPRKNHVNNIPNFCDSKYAEMVLD